MPISQLGSINTTALIVPDLYVQIVPPSVQLINGVASNIVGVVGTANWGPVGSPITVGTYNDYVRNFGQLQNRKFDMGTAVAIAIQQGANAFQCVRVTDGTDAAATIVVQSTCITFNALYTGTLGNSLQVAVAPGGAAGTFKATVTLPGVGITPEVFDNIGAGLTGNALWLAMAAAINSGQSGLRGPSQLIRATAGVGTTAPATAPYTLAGGLDGVGTITSSVMIGSDTIPRLGMYALRESPAQILLMTDLDDSTVWTTVNGFCLFEGMYAILAGVSGQAISAAVTAKATAGIDSYTTKVMLGDWLYWVDTVNGVTRLVNPSAFVAGRLGNLAPNQSSLNKQMYGIAGSQRLSTGAPYSAAELQTLGQAGIDVITNPAPGGFYWAARMGRNSSSNAVIRGDNYTRMTNYIAATINRGMGYVIGKPNTSDTRRQLKATLDSYFGALKQQNLIEDWQEVCDDTNNPPNRVALGYMQSDSKVRYQSITEYLIANLEGGQSVQITRAPVAA
jgi:hypothetical protein